MASPPVVLVHGWGGSRRSWEPVARELETGGATVVAVELPGHGDEPEPDGHSIAEQAAAVARRLDEQGVPPGATIAGHSLGGLVAVALAEREPARAGRLVLVDSPPTMDERRIALFARATFWPLAGHPLWRLARALPQAWLRDSFSIFFAPGFAVPQTTLDDARRLSYRTYRDATRAISDYLDERPLPERIAALGVPLLVLWGERDVFWLPAALERYRSVPGARLETIAGAGHTPMLERPSEVAALIARFAADRAPARR